jgi:hypothetical protein
MKSPAGFVNALKDAGSFLRTGDVHRPIPIHMGGDELITL